MHRSTRTIGGTHTGWRSARRVPPALLVLALAAVPLAAVPVATAPSAAATPAPYVAVKGNRLVNASGATIRLLGVDRSGAEYMCLGGSKIFDGPTGPTAVAAMAAWHINAVRVPLNEDCWLGINGVSSSVSGAKYQQAIEKYVATLQSYGIIVILDLHWAAPSDPDHQLIVSFHTYNFSGCNTEACWKSTIAPLAKKVPIVSGEIGESGCTDTYIDTYMPWADSHGISYLGWTWDSTRAPSHWNCSGGPALIKSYNGTPTAYGVGLKDHLAALAAAPRSGA